MVDESSIWFPFTYHEDLRNCPPVVIERGEGVYLYDRDGNEYIDAIGSWWTSILGHGNAEISAAIKAQLDKIEHVMMAGMVTPPAMELSEHLTALLPDELTHVFYSDDGSTAVEVALKIALQYWSLRGEDRSRFVAFGGSYHGDTLGAMAVGGIPQYHTVFHDRFSRQLFTDPPYCYRCPAGKENGSCNAECMDSLECILKENGSKIAACIFEPMVQGAVGMRIYPAKVLTRVFALCREHGVLTIADEVATGFGRTGRFFACDHAGVVPDMMCLAKGLTAGYLPLAATAVREELYQEFRGAFPEDRIFHHGHTFTGNPLAASAACAVMKILREGDYPAAVGDTMEYFGHELRERFGGYANIGDIRSIGFVGALEFVADRENKRCLPADRRIPFRICGRALAHHGLLIRPLGDVIYFMPAYTITREQIDTVYDRTEAAIRDVLDEETTNL